MLKFVLRLNVRDCNSRKFTNRIIRSIRGSSDSNNENPLFGDIKLRHFYLFSNYHLFGCSSYHLTCENHEINVEKPDDLNYFWNSYRQKLSFKKRCIYRISIALNCSEDFAETLVYKHPQVFLEDIENTIENIQLLEKYNVTKNVIILQSWMLHFNKSDLISRLNEMIQWNLNNADFLALLVLMKLPPKTFFRCSRTFLNEMPTMPYGNRIVYLATLLDTSVKTIITKLMSHRYLLFREFRLIEAAIKAFKEYGVEKHELVRDTWALRYLDTVIRNRLDIVKAKGLPEIKPWLVRCPEDVFYNVINAYETEKSFIHPCQNREEYLSKKLKLEIHLIDNIMKKHSEFRSTNIIKLDKMIDILLAANISSAEMVYYSRIFVHNVDTIQQRLTELKNLGVEAPSLPVVMKAEHLFRETIDRIQHYKSKNVIAL